MLRTEKMAKELVGRTIGSFSNKRGYRLLEWRALHKLLGDLLWTCFPCQESPEAVEL
jgi:hypothetical protein